MDEDCDDELHAKEVTLLSLSCIDRKRVMALNVPLSSMHFCRIADLRPWQPMTGCHGL